MTRDDSPTENPKLIEAFSAALVAENPIEEFRKRMSSPVRCVNHDYYSDTYCPWCRAEKAEAIIERLTRERDEFKIQRDIAMRTVDEYASKGYAMEIERLRAALERGEKEWTFLRGLVAERQSAIPVWLALEWIDDLGKRVADSAVAPRCSHPIPRETPEGTQCWDCGEPL